MKSRGRPPLYCAKCRPLEQPKTLRISHEAYAGLCQLRDMNGGTLTETIDAVVLLALKGKRAEG